MTERTLDLLAAADPARDAPVGPGDVETLLRLAANDVTSYELHLPDRRRRRALAGVAAAVAVVAVTGAAAALVLDRAPANRPVAPRVWPSDCLAELAAGLHAAPYEATTGQYEYVRNAVRFSDRLPMPDGIAWVQYVGEYSTWTTADRRNVRLRTVTESVTFADDASRAYFQSHPERVRTVGTTVVDVRQGVPPEFMGTSSPPPPDSLIDTLDNTGSTFPPARVLARASGMYGNQILDVATRSALLRFIAAADGVVCAGEATDPTGRRGVAVTGPLDSSLERGPFEHGVNRIIVDPSTGDLLAAGYADGTGTIWLAVYLERGFTDSRPAVTR
ncbi:hypothetical protein [Dactylosporangium sp. NPDC050588]|uniref:hypothetical protein n=1 Tax=Dactylosporangium sp. NPDC050588 TaxID=3157211 RepID=UPI0034013D34